MKILLSIIFLLLVTSGFGQVGIGTATVSDAAILEVDGNPEPGEFRGFMPSRVPNETARDDINVTATDVGLTVFVQGTGCLDVYNGSTWEHISCFGSSSPIAPPNNFSSKVPVNTKTGDRIDKKDGINKL